MRRYGFVACLVGIVALGVTQRQTSAADEPVSFSKDVLPILQKNCQSCHRPGQIAPMSLVTFRETRPWARSMKAKVESRQMPPWFADPAHGEFVNDRSLSTRDIQTIATWADNGRHEGSVIAGTTNSTQEPIYRSYGECNDCWASGITLREAGSPASGLAGGTINVPPNVANTRVYAAGVSNLFAISVS